MIWWKCSISFLHIRHFPCCCSRIAALISSNPFSGPFWKSTPLASGFFICMNAKRFTSIAISVIGKYLLIFLTTLRCVWTRWFTVGVNQSWHRFRLQNLASVFRMNLQVTNLSAAYCGSFRIIIPAFIIVLYFLASLWRAFLSPRLDACLWALRSDINFLISLLRVSTTAENIKSPSCDNAAVPTFVLPGSSASVIGWSIGVLLYFSCTVNGIFSTILALPVFNSFKICLLRFEGICGFPSVPRT